MSRWEGKTVIGLTGNIAMGKSLVRRMMEHLGAYTIDADGLAHQAMAPGAPAYKPTILTFGQWILDGEKRIDRAKLGAVAFAHPEALARLEAITHPVVGRAIDTLIKRARHKVIVVEAIKLLEGQLADQMDAIWVVDSTEDIQVKRLMEKRNLSELEALKRIRVQNPQSDKLAKADVVINNNGTPEETWTQVQAAWSQIKGSAEEEQRQAVAQRVDVAPQPATAEKMAITSLDIIRGMPKNADQIATIIKEQTGRDMTRTDVLMAFGQKSYMMAVAGETPVGLVGFLVENLVTRVDEFLIVDRAPVSPVAIGLIQAIENASRELQSEAGYVFLPNDVPAEMTQAFVQEGYEKQAVEEIKVPAWREAVREAQPENTQIYFKKLRAERVLKPL